MQQDFATDQMEVVYYGVQNSGLQQNCYCKTYARASATAATRTRHPDCRSERIDAGRCLCACLWRGLVPECLPIPTRLVALATTQLNHRRTGYDALGVYGDVSARTQITTASLADANTRWLRRLSGNAQRVNGTNLRPVNGIRTFPENAEQNACRCDQEHRASVADIIPAQPEYRLQLTKRRHDLRQDRPRRMTQTKIMRMNWLRDEDEHEVVDDQRADAEHAAADDRAELFRLKCPTQPHTQRLAEVRMPRCRDDMQHRRCEPIATKQMRRTILRLRHHPPVMHRQRPTETCP